MKKINLALMFGLLLMAYSSQLYAQFTSDKDTLVIVSGDSSSFFYSEYDATADTTGGTPYTGTAGYDLNGKILVGVNFDTTSAFTAVTFGIQHSSSYNSAADTAGGSPYSWHTVFYEGDIYTFTEEIGADNILKPQVIYGLKRYIRFICLDGSNVWNVNEAAPRKLIPLIRNGF